jgi:Tfp pilus assembly protein PilW
MNTTSKVATEITVRISLSFQDAPDIHTLLAMTPVRERRRLIFSALERYIETTGHPAGSVDKQIEEISRWLRSHAIRNERNPVDLTAAAYAGAENNLAHAEPIAISDSKAEEKKVVGVGQAPIQENRDSSRSIERWLDI